MRFKRIYIEITNQCNLKCPFCIQNSREASFMSEEQFLHIVKEIKPYTDYVYLHVLGEPLLHPLLDRFLTILEEYQLHVNITTNGTLLKKQLPILKNHRIRQINVSLHSFPHHQQECYLQDVFEAASELAKQGIYVNYRLWMLKDGRFSDECQYILKQVLHEYKQEVTDVKRLLRLSLQDKISLHFECEFEWPSLERPFVGEIGRCLGMKDMCAILVNGDVVACCLDSKGDSAFGNIHEVMMKDILECERVVKMCEGYRKSRLSETLCKHCTYRLRFSRK